jgi:hypothetical protein
LGSLLLMAGSRPLPSRVILQFNAEVAENESWAARVSVI